MHKIVIPLSTLTYRDAPYMRVYISEDVQGFSQLGFRLSTTTPHSFFRHFGCMTLENQRCLAEMLEFQCGKSNCSELLLLTKHHDLEEDGLIVKRQFVGHVIVFSLSSVIDAK